MLIFKILTILITSFSVIFDQGVILLFSDTDGQGEFSVDVNGDEILYLDFEKKALVSTVPTYLDPSLEFTNKIINELAPLYYYVKDELGYIEKKIDELKKANPPLVIGKS